MSAETVQIVHLLEQRILAMNELAESLSGSTAAIVSYDIDGLEARIASQQDLCSRIRDVDLRIEAMQQRHKSRSSSTVTAETQEEKKLRELMSCLQEVHLRVKSLNATHAVLLHRSRRTVRALAHAYQSIATEIYSNPATQCTAVGERV